MLGEWGDGHTAESNRTRHERRHVRRHSPASRKYEFLMLTELTVAKGFSLEHSRTSRAALTLACCPGWLQTKSHS